MNKEKAIEIVENAITSAESGGIVSEYAQSVKGMTSLKIKTFLNRVCGNVSTYLEVGLYKGATFISAIEGNTNLKAIGCDNWSQFGGPKNVFYAYMNERNPGAPVYIYDMDVTSPEFRKKITWPIEVMFYDGDHSYESQHAAVWLFSQVMDDTAILIVDDWKKWGRRPTLDAVKSFGLNVVKMWELPKEKGWWEGVGVLVLTK